MGSASSKHQRMYNENQRMKLMEIEKNKSTEIDLAQIFFDLFLKITNILCIAKIIKVSDFTDLLSNKINDLYFKTVLLNFYEISTINNGFSFYEYHINSDLKIAKKTKNIIRIVRNLMIEKNNFIINNVNAFNENYNEIENNKKITELNELLKIENSKLIDAQFNDISAICENINNLRNILEPFENNKFQFEKRIKEMKMLKITFTNISLFLKFTDYLFTEENKNLTSSKVPYATMVSENLYPSAPYECAEVTLINSTEIDHVKITI